MAWCEARQHSSQAPSTETGPGPHGGATPDTEHRNQRGDDVAALSHPPDANKHGRPAGRPAGQKSEPQPKLVDKLAINRTQMAAERTLMAWVRTASP